jgi:hypothetical protein
MSTTPRRECKDGTRQIRCGVSAMMVKTPRRHRGMIRSTGALDESGIEFRGVTVWGERYGLKEVEELSHGDSSVPFEGDNLKVCGQICDDLVQG